MATGDKLVTLDGMKALKDALYTEPAIFEIAPAQWSGSSGDWYFTVSASNVTEDSILIPQYDVDSAALLNGPIWCVPDDGEFTIHTTAIPGGTVNIMVLFPGTKGVAQVQVLPDAYTTDQVDDMFDNVYTKSEVYTKTETNSAISQSTAGGNGYFKSQDGTLIQWGIASVTRAAGQNSTTITFAQAFTAAPFAVASNQTGAPNQFPVSVNSVNATGLTLILYNTGSAVSSSATVNWLAIGRWK